MKCIHLLFGGLILLYSGGGAPANASSEGATNTASRDEIICSLVPPITDSETSCLNQLQEKCHALLEIESQATRLRTGFGAPAPMTLLTNAFRAYRDSFKSFAFTQDLFDAEKDKAQRVRLIRQMYSQHTRTALARQEFYQLVGNQNAKDVEHKFFPSVEQRFLKMLTLRE